MVIPSSTTKGETSAAGVPRPSSAGPTILLAPLISRPWNTVKNKATADKAAERLCFLLPGKTLNDAEILSRAQGCLLGQFAGDSLGLSCRISIAREDREAIPSRPRICSMTGAHGIPSQASRPMIPKWLWR